MRKISVFYVLVFLIAGPVWSDEQQAERAQIDQDEMAIPCEGNGCDAYVPVVGHIVQYKDIKGQKRLNGALGGLAGAIIGEDVAGAPGAVALGALGVALGFEESNKERWEKQQKLYEEEYQSGADMFYDPSRRLPHTPHWMLAGPAGEKK